MGNINTNERKGGRAVSSSSLNLNGNYQQTLDSKNRVIIPQKFRSIIGTPVTVLRGIGDEKHIRIASAFRWDELCNKFELMDEDASPKEYRKMRILMSTSYSDLNIDSQGRITIPASLREYAGLKKDLIVAGAGRYVEIWDKEAFEQMVNE
jgi:MraZ protein